MEAKLDLDTQGLAAEIATEVLKVLQPVLKGQAEEETIFDVKGLMEYLGVTDDWITKRVTYQEIPYFKLGKYTRFKKSAIDKWLESLSVKPLPLIKNRKPSRVAC